MKQFILLFEILLVCNSAMANVGDIFTAYVNGLNINFKILSSNAAMLYGEYENDVDDLSTEECHYYWRSCITGYTYGEWEDEYNYIQYCNYSGSVIIPEKVYNIDDGNYYAITKVGDYAFAYTPNIESIVLPNTISEIGICAFAESGISSIVIPAYTITIGNSAFSGCTNLTSVDIPNGVISIDDWAFSGCNGLTSVTIGSGVKSIGSEAFAGCSQLADVYCFAEEVPSTNSNAFRLSDIENATLHILSISVDLYRNTEPWKNFQNIVSLSNNHLFCEDLECFYGTTSTLNVDLLNDDEVKLCQFDLRLPDGVTVATKDNGKLDVRLTGRAENHSVSSQLLANGDYRFVIASLENESFTGNRGTLMEIMLDVPTTMEVGEYVVNVLNAELSVPDGNDLKVYIPEDTESKLTVKPCIPGDVNNDGAVSVTDVGCTINYILEQVPSVFIFEAADMNGDRSVSVTDVGMIINLILSEGASRMARNNWESNANNENNILPEMSLMQTTDGYKLLLENKDAYIGFQFDVELGIGSTLSGMQLANDDDHLLTYRQVGNGKWRMVCFSPTNSPFNADEAALLTINTTGDFTVSDIRLTTAGFDELHPAALDAVGGDLLTPTGIAGMEHGMKMSVEGGTLRITSDRDATLRLHSIGGCAYRTLHVKKGVNSFDGLRAGIYMIDNKKLIIR